MLTGAGILKGGCVLYRLAAAPGDETKWRGYASPLPLRVGSNISKSTRQSIGLLDKLTDAQLGYLVVAVRGCSAQPHCTAGSALPQQGRAWRHILQIAHSSPVHSFVDGTLSFQGKGAALRQVTRRTPF